MRQYFVAAIVLFFIQIAHSQSDLKSIIINKRETIESNWVEQIQEKKNWIYVKKVGVKGGRVRDYYENNKINKEWIFEKNDVNILPFHLTEINEKYSNFNVKYYPPNNTFLLTTMVNFRDGQIERNIFYEVINITDEYLILEETIYTSCIDFDSGRKLSKKECEEKYKNQPKRMFGGTQINIGKPAKIRMVLKVKE